MKFKLLLISLLTILRGEAQEIGIAKSDRTIIVKTTNKFAIKDYNGKIILSKIDSIGKNNKQDVYIVKKQNKYGIYSLYGSQIIPIQFDKIERFFNQFWIVEANNKKGIYNIYSNESIPSIFDDIIFSNKNDAEFIVKKDNKFGIYNSKFEEVVPIIYDKIQNIGIIQLELKQKNSFLLKGKIINKNILVNKIFQTYGQYLSDTKTYYIYEEHNKLGIIDNNDSTILEAIYTDIIPKRVINSYLPEYVFFVNNYDKWGMIDITNRLIVPIEYESIDFANTEYLIVGCNKGKQFYDYKNKHLIDNIFFEKYFNTGKYSRLEKNGQETLINNTTMQLIFPFKYESVLYLDNSNYFSVKKNNKYGLINSNEKEIIPLIYDELIIFSCGDKAIVKKDGKYGIINNKNKILLPFTDRYILAYSNSFERRKENSFEMEVFDCELNKVK